MTEFKPYRVGDYIILTGKNKEFWRQLAMALTKLSDTEKKALNGKHTEYGGMKGLVTYQDGNIYIVQDTKKTRGKVWLAPYKGVIPK